MKAKTTLHLLIALFLLFPSLTLLAQEYLSVGARPVGMGEAYVPLADDAYALRWNPAGLDLFSTNEIVFSYTKLLWGFGEDNLNEGFAGYVHHLGKYGTVGLSSVIFYSNVFRQAKLGLSYAKKVTGHDPQHGLSLGMTLDLLRDEIVKSRIEEADPDDPLLTGPAALMAPVIDLAVLQKFKPTNLGGLNVGMAVQNLNQPDVSREGGGKNRLPLYLKPGIAYVLQREFKLHVCLGMTFRSDPVSKENKSRFNLGLEGWAYDFFAARAGVRSAYGKTMVDALSGKPTYSVGTSLRIKTIFDIEVDYSLVIPTTEYLSSFKTHRFSLILRPQPRLKLPDLLVDNEIVRLDETIIAGKETEIEFKVKNAGENEAVDIPVTVYQFSEGSGEMEAIYHGVVANLEPGEDTTLTLIWSPAAAGNCRLTFNADDDGTEPGKVNGIIAESDEKNNSAQVKRRVYGVPEAAVSIEPREIKIDHLSLESDEEPIIPLVFFEPGTWTVDDRFTPLLNTITKRLLTNKNVKLNIKGYYNLIDDDVKTPIAGRELAQKRAEQIRKTIITRSRELQNRVEWKLSGYKPGDFMVGDVISLKTHEDADLLNEENRRVEFTVVIPGADGMNIPVDADLDSIRATLDLSNKRKILENNPDVLVLIETPENIELSKAHRVEKLIRELLGIAEDRLFSILTKESPGNFKIKLYGDWLLEKPIQSVGKVRELKIATPELKIRTATEYDTPIINWQINLVDSAKKVLTNISEGIKIGGEFSWNWKDDENSFMIPENQQRVQYIVIDSLGLTDTAYSEGFQIGAIDKMEVIENIILTRCFFDKVEEVAPGQRARFGLFAQRLIQEAHSGEAEMNIGIKGYTDNTGAEGYNQGLSLNRAKYGKVLLLEYLGYHLGFSDNSKVLTWLQDNHIALNVEGQVIAGFQETDKKGALENKLGMFGNNELPEGRNSNRRISVTLSKVERECSP